MKTIIEILSLSDHKTYATVKVRVVDELGNQEEAAVYVGGAVEVFYHAGQVKAFVKKGRPSEKPQM